MSHLLYKNKAFINKNRNYRKNIKEEFIEINVFIISYIYIIKLY